MSVLRWVSRVDIWCYIPRDPVLHYHLILLVIVFSDFLGIRVYPVAMPLSDPRYPLSSSLVPLDSVAPSGTRRWWPTNRNRTCLKCLLLQPSVRLGVHMSGYRPSHVYYSLCALVALIGVSAVGVNGVGKSIHKIYILTASNRWTLVSYGVIFFMR